jgi:hypothetical protein
MYDLRFLHQWFYLLEYNAKDNEMGRACNIWGEKRNVCSLVGEKPEGKRPLGKPSHKWEDNTKMNLREIGWGYEVD